MLLRNSNACLGRVAASRRLRLSIEYASILVVFLSWSVTPQSVRAVSSTVVISEFRARGPNGGSDEFVELYNLSSSSIDISGWKLSGSNNAGTVSVRATVPSGKTIPARGHYLFTNSSTAAGPYSGSVVGDQTYATGITDDGGIAITLPDDTIVDQAGLSSGSAYTEGTPLASLGTSNLDRSYERKPGGAAGSGQDSDNNSADFVLITPSDPQNTNSAPSGSPTNPTGSGASNPSTITAGGSTLLTVQVTPGQNPASTGLAVAADLSPIGGLANQPLLDDGSNGDVTAADLIFSLQASVSSGTAPGAKSIPVSISDAQARSGSAVISLTIQSSSIVPGAVVISQIYGGGGNSGAVFKNDFIELFNRSSNPVNVSGWSVQYTSATGALWQKTDLTGTIPPGRYLLVQEASGTGGSVNLTPDVVGSIMMAAGAGKVALVSSTTLLTGGCPASSSIIDFAGYGSTADCFEGAGPTAAPGNTTAALRRNSGCIDSDNNAADFFTGTPSPKNSGAPFNSCTAPPVSTFAIHEIQGSGLTSPHVGETVQTTVAIVTAVKNNGFFIQTTDTDVDADANTSEGIFVFTSSPPSVAAAVGNAVAVTGRVVEFIPSADPASPPLTELAGTPTVSLISTGNTLPLPITLTAASTSPTGPVEQLERFEGMRVRVDSLTAIAPTQGTVSEANATSTSNGVFYAVITGLARPFREPGIQVPDPLPPASPNNIARFDGNPERLRIDSGAQIGSTRLEVTSNASITNVTGVLDFSFRTYSILTDPTPVPAVTGNLSAQPVPDPKPDQFSVASFNMERFFDTVNDPGIDDVPLTPAAFTNRLNKASLAIRNVMKSPDIIGVVEVENLATLQAIATKVNSDSMAAGKPNPLYIAALVEGNDIGGIDVGLLVKSARVVVQEVIQEGKDATYINPGNGQPELLNDRPSLILRASIPGVVDPIYQLTIIVNHLRSLSGVDDPADGARVRAKRRAQAEFLANLVQRRQLLDPAERIVLVGDFNAFQFNDGYVDMIGTIKGTPAPADQVVLASSALVNPVLTNLVDAVPAAERYSFSFDGNAQVLDHILVNNVMLPSVRNVYYARNDADFAESMRADASRPERISDHDMPVAYFTMDITPPQTTATIAESQNANGWYTSDVHVTLNATDNPGGSGVQSIKYSLTGATTGGGTVDAASLPIVLSAEGTTTLKYDAVDRADIVESTDTLVIKIDKTRPSLACPQSIVAEASGSGGATVNYFAATASDTVSSATVGYSKASGTMFPIGITTVDVTATDEAGHRSACSFTVTVRASSLTLGPARLWVGLRNSDDQGTRFDLQAQVYKNGVLAGEAVTRCVTGITRNVGAAKEVEVSLSLLSPTTVVSGDVLSIKLLTRIGTEAAETRCGGHSNAAGLRFYYDAMARPSHFSAAAGSSPMSNFFLHSNGGSLFANAAAPTSTAGIFRDSPAVNFAGGNPWKEIGTWTLTIP